MDNRFPYPLYIETDTWDADRVALASRYQTLTIADEYAVEMNQLDFVDAVVAIISKIEPRAQVGAHSDSHGVYGIRAARVGDAHPFVLVSVNYGIRRDPSISVRSNVAVVICAPRPGALLINTALKERFGGKRLAFVEWWFMGGRTGKEADHRSVVLDPPAPVHAEYYPWLTNGPNGFLQEYLDANSTILFMMGPAGTGKTSLIRYFLYHWGLSAMVTYEDALLNSDAMFVEFMTSATENVLVIEDADLMLGSREHHGNKLISRFLNVSDGIIKFPGKKIIFTTNLGDFSNVDPALIRPGRCFGALNFRALTFHEQVAAARVAGIAPPTAHVERTLAELFNEQGDSVALRKIGFAAS